MALNCTAGDLAVVIDDEPGCEDNVGRIVRVLWSTTVSDSSDCWWSIRPVDGQPWTCIRLINGGQWVEVYQSEASVCIEDRCLRPIRGQTADRQSQAEAAHTTQSTTQSTTSTH